ncbi:DUF3828 domain-containing protein [Phreatobacter sp. AB_2022a]|uniref:DUF3828 domain-containing protein n=1 Tax=Phreatobacter sp. AB_2022a TaxID=3003134 RepID=UPI0022875C03|nr:DUF3828 domain-containing protein [Phreatobacter sp. AB_2022a]MCZ0735806.1 DUF3828 domain-containing protein [Phreatobacter sp. AB_2022a]
MTLQLSRRDFVFGGAAGLALTAGPAWSAASAESPVDTVKALYAKPVGASDAPFLSRRLKRLFAAQRARARRTSDVLAGLDFDYSCGCQDYDEAFRQTLRYDLAGLTARTAQVTAHFGLFGASRAIVYSLVKENGRWLIDDIAGSAGPGADWRMSRLLRTR